MTTRSGGSCRSASAWSPRRWWPTAPTSRSRSGCPGWRRARSSAASASPSRATARDPGGLTTRAVRDGDDWVLSGQKIFITNGNWAGLALIFARTGGPGPRGITAFLVDTSSPGFSARPVLGKLGLRAQDTAELFLDEVRVARPQPAGRGGPGFRHRHGRPGQGPHERGGQRRRHGPGRAGRQPRPTPSNAISSASPSPATS